MHCRCRVQHRRRYLFKKIGLSCFPRQVWIIWQVAKEYYLEGSLCYSIHRCWWFHSIFRPSSSQTLPFLWRVLGDPVHLLGVGSPVVNVIDDIYCTAVTKQTDGQKMLPLNLKTERMWKNSLISYWEIFCGHRQPKLMSLYSGVVWHWVSVTVPVTYGTFYKTLFAVSQWRAPYRCHSTKFLINFWQLSAGFHLN